MNKKEHHETITELTILASRLRRRRDSWRSKAESLERKIKSLESRLEAAVWTNGVYDEALAESAKSNADLTEQVRGLTERLSAWESLPLTVDTETLSG